MALRAGLLAGWLQACAALPALPHLVSAAGGAGVVAAWQVATEVNEIAYQSEADVCGGWGLIYHGQRAFGFATPPVLKDAEDTVADFCSGDPPIGATPIATLKNLGGIVLKLAAAQAPARSPATSGSPS